MAYICIEHGHIDVVKTNEGMRCPQCRCIVIKVSESFINSNQLASVR